MVGGGVVGVGAAHGMMSGLAYVRVRKALEQPTSASSPADVQAHAPHAQRAACLSGYDTVHYCAFDHKRKFMHAYGWMTCVGQAAVGTFALVYELPCALTLRSTPCLQLRQRQALQHEASAAVVQAVPAWHAWRVRRACAGLAQFAPAPATHGIRPATHGEDAHTPGRGVARRA